MPEANAVEETEKDTATAELPEGIEAEATEAVEVDYSDAEGTAEAEPAPEPEADPAPPAADPMLELRDELRRLKQQNSELQGYYHRLAGSGWREEEGPEEMPEHLQMKPRDQWNADDVITFYEWDKRRTTQEIRAQALAEARAASSESRARGLFNASSLGANYDYDSVISRHVEPMERDNPAFRQLIAQQADPAIAKYMLGFMMEMLEASGGDQVKMVKNLRDAMQRKSRTNQEVFTKIKAAEKKAAVKTTLRPTRASGAKKPLTADDIDRMDLDEFIRLEQRVRPR